MTDQLHRSLGHLSVAYAELEDRIKDLLAALIQQDRRTIEILTCRTSLLSLCDILNVLFPEKVADADLLEFFGELMPQVDWCRVERNKYIHSSWFTQEPSIPYIRSDPQVRNGNFRDRWEAMGSGDIRDTAECVEETATGVFELIMHMQQKGLTDYLADTFTGWTLPEKLPRNFKPRDKPT